MSDLRQAFELDPETAASVFGLGQVDDLRPLIDATRWLTEQRPGDLEEILTAVSRAMHSTDAWERLAQLLMLESALDLRVSKAVEGADIAHAATIDLALSAMADVITEGTVDDAICENCEPRMQSSRTRLAVGSAFEASVDAMKAELTRGPTERPPMDPIVG